MAREPVLFQDILDIIVKKLGWSELYLQSRLENDWTELLGENISKVVKIKRIKNRTLILKINSSTWRIEMTLRKEWLMELINSKYGENSINEVVIR